MPSFRSEVAVYVGRVREFERADWLVYAGWVGLMLGLVVSTGGFLYAGHRAGVTIPAEAWLIPAGAAIFAAAISIDTIGHRTVYKQALAGGEALVHHITILCGIASVVLLVIAYSHPFAAIPALVFTVLSFVYSLVDEVFHWRRYVSERADRVEMWSHVFIFVGHGIMMAAWWWYYTAGYPGVRETLEALS